MTTEGDLACTYAALILADDDIDVTADKIIAILKAAKCDFVEPYMPGMFASSLSGQNIKQVISNIGSAAAAPSADTATASGAGGAAPAAEAKKEAKQEEPDSDSDGSMGFDLFG